MSRFIITADWDTNAPHLSEKARKELWDSIPAYQKDARTKGIPQLGAGVIYPVPEDDLLVDPFPFPDHWPHGFGLDVGWNRTACVWEAYDPDANPRIYYAYDEYYRGEADPEVHGAAIRKRGAWIPGRIDPAAHGRNQVDGSKLISLYRKAIYGHEDLALGMRLLGTAVNAVESGLYQLLIEQQQGLTKIFRTRCPNLLAERRLYRRDEKGRVVKKKDHLMDAWRYRHASGDGWMAQKPAPPVEAITDRMLRASGNAGLSWMGS